MRFLHWVFGSHGKRNWTYIRVAVIFSSYLVRLFSYSDPLVKFAGQRTLFYIILDEASKDFFSRENLLTGVL